MAKIQYLTYYIHLTDPDQVRAFQAQYPVGVNRAIYNVGPPEGGAAIEFAAPFRGYTEPAAGDAPFTWTPWSGAGSSAGPYPINVATFTRRTGGFLGIGGTTTRYYWVGQFVLAASTSPEVNGQAVAPAEMKPIAQRHFCEGFEIPGYALGTSTGNIYSPDASAHVGGLGLAVRGETTSISAAVDLFATGSTASKRWDRFRVRWRDNGGTQTIAVWRAHAFPTPGNGGAVSVLPSGQLGVENINGGARQLLGAVHQLVAHEFALVDVLYEFNTAATNGFGRLRVLVNHNLVADFAVGPTSGGIGANSQRIGSVSFGNVFALQDDNFVDLDDWIQSEFPTSMDDATAPEWVSGTAYVANNLVRTTTGYVYRCTTNHTASSSNQPGTTGGQSVWTPQGYNDFFNGSKVVLVRADGFGAAHGAWTGDYRRLLQTSTGNWGQKQTMASSTSGALLAATTDAEIVCDEEVNSIGVAAFQVCLFSFRGAASGTLGYAIPGSTVDTAIVQVGTTPTFQPNAIMYRPTGLTSPADITPLELRHTKGASADNAEVTFMAAQAELLGVFMAGDQRATELTGGGAVAEHLLPLGVHNRPYPRTPWALDAQSAPISPFIIYAGTYVGDGLFRTLQFRSPVHWLRVRPVTGDTGGGWWWSSMQHPHFNGHQEMRPPFAVRCEEDRTFVPASGEDVQQQRFLLHLVGADTQVNAAGVTYQYIAISDPGARFMHNAASRARNNGADATHLLADLEFVPEWAWGQLAEDTAATATVALAVKSPGHTSDAVTRINGNHTTAAMSFGTGRYTTRNALHQLLAAGNPMGFSFWRVADGNNDPGQAAVSSFGSYTGDGAASRTMTVGSAGKRPLWAIVVAESGTAAITRDPNHTGVNSSLVTGTNSTTGITAGAVNQITVGATLNTNTVLYHYFILWAADATAGNGGWGTNPASGEIVPVEAESPNGSTWPNDPSEAVIIATNTPATVTPVADPGDLTTDIAATCLAASTRLVNSALQLIGVTQQIASLATDVSREAVSARLVYKTELDATLRAFPWGFAKRYANLTLVAGTSSTPVNHDWQYSYRGPADCVFVRRIVDRTKKRGFDDEPIAFEVVDDDTGVLIFTDEPIVGSGASLVPVQIEYTARVACPASRGDAIFRSAAIARLGAALGPGLSRDAKAADRCMKLFAFWLGQAQLAAARERQEQNPGGGGEAEWIREAY